MKTIHLVSTYQSFDMIARGKKLEDYREIKPYYEELKNLKEGDKIVFHRDYTSEVVEARVKYCCQSFGLVSWGGDPNKTQWVIGIYIPQK